MDNARDKKDSFDKEVKTLLLQLEETVRTRYSTSLKLGEERQELTSLIRYNTIYNNMDAEEHYVYFENLYNRNRSSVLNCMKDDRWIRIGRLYVQFGEGMKGIEEKCKDIRIMLSDIFLIACELQDKAEKSFAELDILKETSAGGKDLIRPSIILLHLLRIFYILNDGEDKKELAKIVSKLEEDLGANKTVQVQETSKIGEGAFGNLFNIATNMMQKMGMSPPPNMVPPTDAEIGNTISNIFSDEKAQGVIQGMLSSIQGCDDMGSVMQNIFNSVSDPATIDVIKDMVTPPTKSE